MLFGRSQRRYGHVATHLAETFGFRASTVGRVFIQETAKALDPFMNRRFDDQEFVGLFMDGKTLRSQQMILVVGPTERRGFSGLPRRTPNLIRLWSADCKPVASVPRRRSWSCSMRRKDCARASKKSLEIKHGASGTNGKTLPPRPPMPTLPNRFGMRWKPPMPHRPMPTPRRNGPHG